ARQDGTPRPRPAAAPPARIPGGASFHLAATTSPGPEFPDGRRTTCLGSGPRGRGSRAASGLVFLKGRLMTQSHRPPLRPPRRGPPARLRLTELEQRCNPVSVANVLANTPEANQANLTANYTQNETSTITFGGTVLVSFNDSGSFATGNRFTG